MVIGSGGFSVNPLLFGLRHYFYFKNFANLEIFIRNNFVIKKSYLVRFILTTSLFILIYLKSENDVFREIGRFIYILSCLLLVNYQE